ncbi:hypothetical protein FRACYDRAFT_268166 [Fragilariopsis cylindrus CCMP1102]|uniref:Uncharacterized protein n=1 Tax=Fragilariopsis cylindrus CCMP1102 TaxID=635003 RepID=A0A1E7FPK2_9STRA|nr:hypothetical protein FRACYDRAFT_268166 [Fragilariopsis cylindrus CCMP1102]|eukprot:OEU20076.1 hypothetical protein FRACYDRAFT_268166 [Fragilariopsis cylindrus CCMP1102]
MMMMKTCTFVLAFATLLSSAIAAPAVVWQSSSTAKISSSNARSLHSSEDIHASELMKNVLTISSSEAPALSAVIFLIGKGDDGSEQLSELASGGKLPLTFAKYNDATGVYHSVSGVESTGSIVKVAGNAITTEGNNNNNKNKNNRRVLEVTLNEFNSKLTSLDTAAVVDPVAEVEIDSNGTPSSTTSTSTSTNKRVTKRARALAQADIYIVNVNPTTDASTQIDNSIVQAIEHKNVGAVVLGGIRSIEEVKHERFLTNQRRMTVMESNGNKIMDNRRRRLEEDGDANDDAAQADNANNDDLSGVYYVAMTPNILAGLLFTLLFLVVTYTGISCMGDIQGGDCFTDKYPSLGREA